MFQIQLQDAKPTEEVAWADECFFFLKFGGIFQHDPHQIFSGMGAHDTAMKAILHQAR